MNKNIKIKNKSKEFNRGYVSGLIDSEGYINKEKSYIMIINTNKEVLDNCKKFLDLIKINSTISERKLSEKDKKKSYRIYQLSLKAFQIYQLKYLEYSFNSGVEQIHLSCKKA